MNDKKILTTNFQKTLLGNIAWLPGGFFLLICYLVFNGSYQTKYPHVVFGLHLAYQFLILSAYVFGFKIQRPWVKFGILLTIIPIVLCLAGLQAANDNNSMYLIWITVFGSYGTTVLLLIKSGFF